MWLGNNRGNIYSRGSVMFDVNDREYFDFSFYEIGTKDLPAIVNLVCANANT